MSSSKSSSAQTTNNDVRNANIQDTENAFVTEGGNVTINQTDLGSIEAAADIAERSIRANETLGSDVIEAGRTIAKEGLFTGRDLAKDSFNLSKDVVKTFGDNTFSVFSKGIDAITDASRQSNQIAKDIAGQSIVSADSRTRSDSAQTFNTLIKFGFGAAAVIAVAFFIGKRR